jgi:predicted GH43/DUF377 family glycosyl hydrolase
MEELGKYAVAYTAFSRGGPGVALALTEDFRRLERCGLVMQPDDKDAALRERRGSWWDANKVGLSPPLIETPRGWLMIYHDVRQTASGALYRLGLALLDLAQPDRCLLRGDMWVFGPEAPYEREGDVGNVAFPCGYTIGADGDTLFLYYGAADTSVALATGSIRGLLRWLDQHGSAGG